MAEDNDRIAGESKWYRFLQTAVLLLTLISFLGVILITFYNQYTGRQTLPANLPKVAFIGWDENDTLQLFVTAASDGDKPRQLTFETEDVTEFAVTATGTAVAYVVQTETGETAIKMLDWNGREASNHRPLLGCPEAPCERLVWHPDGRRLIYERRAGNGPQLWWLDSLTGETITVLEEETAVSQAASFSPDGRWLSFADPLNEELGLYELGRGTQSRLTNLLGSPATWHPTEEIFLFNDFDLITYHGDENETGHQEHSHDFDQSIHLYLGDTNGTSSALLSETGNVDDANPAWSPVDDWIAFGRKPIGTTAARQLWLTRPDGSEVRALTDDLNIHYGPPIWSPDGRYLLFQRYDITDPEAKPGVWLLEVKPGNLTQVANAGFIPAWLP